MDVEHITPIILAGGRGMRLRPITSPAKPKPFVKLASPYNMLQETLLRCAGMGPPIIVCEKRFGDQVQQSVEELAVYDILPRAIVEEPCVRSTAPAIASAVMAMAPHQVFAVFPSDQVIGREGPLFQAISYAARHVLKHGGLVSVGVKPWCASRRFGYMHKGDAFEDGGLIYNSRNFAEKPLAAEAKACIKSKQYLWNTGIFVGRVADYLHEFSITDTNYMELVKNAFAKGKKHDNIYELNPEYYYDLPEMSVDNAIFERINNRYVAEFEGFWDDAGTLPSFFALWIMRLCGIIKR